LIIELENSERLMDGIIVSVANLSGRMGGAAVGSREHLKVQEMSYGNVDMEIFRSRL
jgi:hypothetical protein